MMYSAESLGVESIPQPEQAAGDPTPRRGLLIVDLQTGFHPPGSLVDEIRAYAGQFDVVVQTQFQNTEGSLYRTVLGRNGDGGELLLSIPGAIILKKLGYGLTQRQLTAIASLECDEWSICGLETDACVMACAYSLWDAGIAPRIIGELCASPLHGAGMSVLSRQFGSLVQVDPSLQHQVRLTPDDALELVDRIHAGQTDRTGAPYIEHLIAVMELLPGDASDDDRIIALFHDALEDRLDVVQEMANEWRAGATVDEYLLGIGMSVHSLEGIRLLTHDGDEAYLDYVRRIVRSGHRGARWVKRADNEHNSDRDRAARIQDPVKRAEIMEMIDTRYRQAREILDGVTA